MDTLMNAAKAADVSLNPTVKGYKESKINMFKFTRIIGKVFVESYEHFQNVEDADTVIEQLMNDSKFILSLNKKGVNENCITIKEALKWTAHYVRTGEKLKITLIAAFTPEVAADNPEAHNVELWTAVILNTTEVPDNNYVFNCCGKECTYHILNKSVNSYEVQVR